MNIKEEMEIDRFEYNDFVYTKDYSNSRKLIQIDHHKEKPKSLFKFFAFNKYNVDALTKGYFYASHPFELNDILDSSPYLLFSSKPLEYEYYKLLLGNIYSEDELLKFYKEDITNDNLCKGYIFKYYQMMTNRFGIISTTGQENNTLMWPHYTEEKGFQLKFNVEKLEKSIRKNLNPKKDETFLGLFPVNYANVLSPIDISQFNSMFVPLYYHTNLKSIKWKYEDEWRFFISKENMGVPYSKTGFSNTKDYFKKKGNRYSYYDKEIIEEITLGINFFNGRNFKVERLDNKRIRLKPINTKNNSQYKSHNKLLKYISKNLKDKLYSSSVKYELDHNETPYLIRTKEKLEIELEKNGYFLITRTDEIIKFFN